MKPKRTVEQIIAAVKGAVAGRGAAIALTGSTALDPAAVRLSPTRFVLVRDILDVDGCAPGKTNTFFPAAVAAAERFGIITHDESERFFAWYHVEKKAEKTRSERADLEQRAGRLGLRLVGRVRTK